MYNTLLRMSCSFAAILLLIIPSINAHDDDDRSPELFSKVDCFTVPIMDCPPDLIIGPGNGIDPTWTGFPFVTVDSIGCPDPIVTYTDQIDTLDICHYRILRSWTATNPEDSSLFVQCVQSIQTIDNDPPLIINCPQDVTVYTNTFDCESYINWAEPIYQDESEIISISLSATKDGVPVNASSEGYYASGVYTFTYRVEDACEHVSYCQFQMDVMCARCHLICPDEACVSTESNISPDILGYAESWEGNENCGDAEIDFEDIVMDSGCNGSMTIYRVWTAVFETMPDFDYTCSQLIELKDDTEVVIFNCPEDITVDHNFIPVHWEQPQAVNGSYVVTLTSNYPAGSFFPVGVTTVIFTAVDECGNMATCSFTVTVFNDMTYSDCPEDMEVECSAHGEAYIEWEVPAYDGSCDACLQGDRISGFVFIGSMNNKKYYCSLKSYTWPAAQALAAKWGGKLVTVNSKEENDFLASSIMARTAFIGLNDAAKEGKFVWDSGAPVTYSNWFEGQPNNSKGNQDYVELMNTGAWNDVDNETSLEFVMEIPCQYVTQLHGPQVNTYVAPGDYTVLYEISDGCGLRKYCQFNINIQDGVSIKCPEDINIELPGDQSGIIVNWEEPQASTCCHKCDDDNSSNCVFVTLESGDPSGSIFLNDTRNIIRYKAKDWCHNHSYCFFNVNIIKSPASMRSPEDDTEFNMDSPFQDLAFRQMGATNDASDGVFVYPTPASENLFINDQNYTSHRKINLYSNDGRLVASIPGGKPLNNTIGVRHLESGLYIVHIDYEDDSFKLINVFVK